LIGGVAPDVPLSDDYPAFIAARAKMLTEFGRKLAQRTEI
jgi:hypothetical protein